MSHTRTYLDTMQNSKISCLLVQHEVTGLLGQSSSHVSGLGICEVLNVSYGVTYR